MLLNCVSHSIICTLFPQQSWQNDIELQTTSSVGKVTAAQNTDTNLGDAFRHHVANGTPKQAFAFDSTRARKEGAAFPAFHSKNAPVKVSVSGEWALKECEVCNQSFVSSLKIYVDSFLVTERLSHVFMNQEGALRSY